MSSRIATAPHLYVKRPIEEHWREGKWAESRLDCDCINGINGINITSNLSNFYAWFVGLGILHLQFTPLSKHAEHLTAVGCKFQEKKGSSAMFFCCQGQHTLPMGLAEDLRAAQVKIFCPKCEQAGWRRNKPSLHNRFGMPQISRRSMLPKANTESLTELFLGCPAVMFSEQLLWVNGFSSELWRCGVIGVFQN